MFNKISIIGKIFTNIFMLKFIFKSNIVVIKNLDIQYIRVLDKKYDFRNSLFLNEQIFLPYYCILNIPNPNFAFNFQFFTYMFLQY